MKQYKWPYTNYHDLNLDWILETVKACKENVEGIIDEVQNILKNFVTKEELTNERKLSSIGDFTGTLCNSTKTACEVVSGIDSNYDSIKLLTEQFEDGATGQVVECGYFGDDEINRLYDGGVW